MFNCRADLIQFVFDREGHTKIICTGQRKMCPHNRGKCPALENSDKIDTEYIVDECTGAILDVVWRYVG